MKLSQLPIKHQDAVKMQLAREHNREFGCVDTIPQSKSPIIEPRAFSITIKGQIRGGKNGIKITKKGKRYPCAKWAKWRDDAVSQVLGQVICEAITKPTNIRLDYWAGDKRRRDMPAVIDAIFHVLEKAGVVKDDTLLWVSESSRNYDNGNPHAKITFL